MARGRRRAEWTRFGELLSLVYNRTGFGDDFQPTTGLHWWPDGLPDPADWLALKLAKARGVTKGSIKDVQSRMGL